MKTVFGMNQAKTELTVYQLGNEEKKRQAIQHLIVHASNFSHYGKSVRFICDRDLGDAHFVSGDGNEVFLCKKESGEMPYVYLKKQLPKEINHAFQCMNQLSYSNLDLYQRAEQPLSFREEDDIYLEEVQVLANATKDLMLSTIISPSSVDKDNLEAVYKMLDALTLSNQKTYEIKSAEEMLTILERYYHIATNALRHYLSVSPKVKTVNELWASVMIGTKDPLLANDRTIIKQSMQAFGITPEWLNFEKKVDMSKERVRQLIK